MSEEKVVKIKVVLIKDAGYKSIMPKMATKAAAAYDLYAAKDGELKEHGQEVANTGVRMMIPFGYRGIIKCRSGLAFKNKLSVEAGVIDSDYRDEVMVILSSRDHKPFKWKAGDRIAQIKIEKIPPTEMEEVDDFPKEGDNERKGGLGSTGV